MKSLRISSRGQNKGGARVEDGSAVAQSEISAVDGDSINVGFPEPDFRDVVDCGEGRDGEFVGIESSECDFAVIEIISGTGDLVRSDSFRDKPLLGECVDWRQRSLLGEVLTGITS